MNTSNSDQIREAVRENYGEIAQSASSCCDASSCCTQTAQQPGRSDIHMREKNRVPNSGVPIVVNHRTDLVAKPGANIDSWYVNCSFEHEGSAVGFEWHQMTLRWRGLSRRR